MGEVRKGSSFVGCPAQQGTVLGPLLFSLYIKDISTYIESEIRLCADDCVCYREIKEKEDIVKLQNDIYTDLEHGQGNRVGDKYVSSVLDPEGVVLQEAKARC